MAVQEQTTSQTETEPEGYYTSKYSGEEIDALLDSIAKLRQDVDMLTAAQGLAL